MPGYSSSEAKRDNWHSNQNWSLITHIDAVLLPISFLGNEDTRFCQFLVHSISRLVLHT